MFTLISVLLYNVILKQINICWTIYKKKESNVSILLAGIRNALYWCIMMIIASASDTIGRPYLAFARLTSGKPKESTAIFSALAYNHR